MSNYDKLESKKKEQRESFTGRFSGYTDILGKDVTFLECPNVACKTLYYGMLLESKTSAKCYYGCKQVFDLKLFKCTKVNVPAVVCANCNKIVPLVDSNVSISGDVYVCDNDHHYCSNVLGLYSESSIILDMKTVLNNNWNNPFKFEHVKISDNVYIRKLNSNRERDKLVLLVLQMLGKEDEGAFRIVRWLEKEHNEVYYLIFNDNEYIGYKITNEDNDKKRYETLQTFVRREFRRAGIASTLFKWWVDNVVKDNELLIHSPNHLTCNMLIKLGYAQRVNDKQIKGLNCKFTTGW